jgi:hypothetical protein
MKIEHNLVLNWTALQVLWKISKTKRFAYPKIIFRTKSEVLSIKNEKFKLEQTSIPFKINNQTTLVPMSW